MPLGQALQLSANNVRDVGAHRLWFAQNFTMAGQRDLNPPPEGTATERFDTIHTAFAATPQQGHSSRGSSHLLLECYKGRFHTQSTRWVAIRTNRGRGTLVQRSE